MAIKKTYKLSDIRAKLENFNISDNLGSYPEFKEDSSCSWDFEGWGNLTERDMGKLINEGLLVYMHIQGVFVPRIISEL